MKLFTRYIGSQFRQPHGIVGRICCLIMNLMNRAMYRQVLKNIHLSSTSSLLEIGFGNGYLLSKLSKRCVGTLYGIDLSPDMLALASQRNRKIIASGRMHLQIADSCYLPFANELFHSVVSINTFYFCVDVAQVLSEVYRTLQPGGVFYNVVYTKTWLQQLTYTQSGFHFYEADDYLRYGYAAGFKCVTIKPIIAGKSFMVLFEKSFKN